MAGLDNFVLILWPSRRTVRAACCIAFLLLLCVACAISVANDGPVSAQDDARNIYRSFLAKWIADEGYPVNVSRVAAPVAADESSKYSLCTSQLGYGTLDQVIAGPVQNLDRSIGDVPGVEFIDPKTWRPLDPEELIAKGESIDSAVEKGFKNGLLTLSGVTFDRSGKSASLKYSLICGDLCGHGGVALFRKTAGGWVQDEHSCGHWNA